MAEDGLVAAREAARACLNECAKASKLTSTSSMMEGGNGEASAAGNGDDARGGGINVSFEALFSLACAMQVFYDIHNPSCDVMVTEVLFPAEGGVQRG
jgi:hypothetical protein